MTSQSASDTDRTPNEILFGGALTLMALLLGILGLFVDLYTSSRLDYIKLAYLYLCYGVSLSVFSCGLVAIISLWRTIGVHTRVKLEVFLMSTTIILISIGAQIFTYFAVIY